MRRRDLLVGVASPAMVVLAWLYLGHVGALERSVLPSLPRVVDAASEGVRTGFLWSDLRWSLSRVLPGIVIGSILGAAFGMLTGRVRLFAAALGPLFHVGRALPAVALVPLFIGLFGIGETGKVLVIAFGVFWPVWISAHIGAQLVGQTYLDLARNYEFPVRERFVRVLLPASLPFFVSGIRTGIGVAFVMLFIGEWIGAASGVGYRIGIGHTVGRGDLMVLGLIELGLLALVTDQLFARVTRYVFPWLRACDG